MEFQFLFGFQKIGMGHICADAQGAGKFPCPGGVPSLTASNIENAVARFDLETIEINGNHG